MVNQPKKQITMLNRYKLAKKFNVPVDYICPECGSVMEPVLQNNGFQAPDPEMWELDYYLCHNCGHKE